MDVYLSEIVRYLIAQSWQIAALVVVMTAITFALRSRSAHVRYLLWLIVLAKCVVPPVLSVPVKVLPQSPPAAEALTGPSIEPTRVGATVLDSPSAGFDRALPHVVGSGGIGVASDRPADASVRSPAATRPTLALWAGIVWATGAATYLMMNLLRALRGGYWLRRRRRAVPADLARGVGQLLSACGIGRLPRIWLVDGVGQPFVWGLVRGGIYLPTEFLCTGTLDRRKSALAHEVIHIRRCDAAVNTLQVIALAIFWFHPFVWWAHRRIRVEREKSCDEAAIASLGASPRDYSSVILETLAARHTSSRPVPSLAVAGPAKDIEERIRTMMTPGKRFYRRPGPAIVGVAMLLALLTAPTTIALTPRAAPDTASPGVLLPASISAATTADEALARTRVAGRGEDRVIHFPADRSVGHLQIQEAGATRELTWFVHWTEVKGSPWEDLCEAQGDVRVPAGKRVALTVNRFALRDLSWLAQLGPDDLYSLSLPGLSTDPAKASDACMPLIARLTGLRDLSLHQTDITNSGLGHITKLRSLEYLDAPSRMTDRGMAYVAELPSLKGLYIGAGSASMMTDAGLSHLAKLTSLEELYLRGERMSDAGLAHIAGLPRLEYLGLYGSRFTDRGMAYVKKIPSLRILSFHEGVCRITDAGLAHIAQMPKLEFLLLGVTGPVTDNGIRYLTKMPSLRKLHIDSPLISDRGLEYLGQIKTLEHLTLPQDQHGITDAGLTHLSQLTNLRGLHVSRIHFNDPAMNKEYYTDRGLQALANCRLLEELNVGSLGITDVGLDHIAKLTSLKKLMLFGCENVTDAGLAKLTALQSLTDLYVTDANVTISGISQLGSLKHLARLTVFDVRRGNAILDLSGMANLEKLSLSFAPRSDEAFGDTDLACLANLKTLRWLQIGPRDYTDAGLVHLSGLTNMERLNLGGSRLTDEGLKHLANLKRLGLLSIAGPFDAGTLNWSSGGHFTDEALRTLEQFKKLTLLEIHSDNTFSDAAVQRLRETLPNLYSLNLNGSDGQPTGMGVRAATTPAAPRVRQRTARPRPRR